ncbi:hypothetical protein AtEden1_Chr4g0292201 [Arabidopsis thaliana]
MVVVPVVELEGALAVVQEVEEAMVVELVEVLAAVQEEEEAMVVVFKDSFIG